MDYVTQIACVRGIANNNASVRSGGCNNVTGRGDGGQGRAGRGGWLTKGGKRRWRGKLAGISINTR